MMLSLPRTARIYETSSEEDFAVMPLRLFCFSDLHCDIAAARRLAGEALVGNMDLLVSAGDLAVNGRHLREVYAAFAWADRPVLAVPGNHDLDAPYRAEIEAARWTDLDGVIQEHGGYWIAGHGYSGGERAYSGPDPVAQAEDSALTDLLRRVGDIPRERLVLLTHVPPHGTLSARDHKFIDRGNVQLAKWIREHQPAALVCGHVHHREPVTEMLGDTRIVNPGPYGLVLTMP